MFLKRSMFSMLLLAIGTGGCATDTGGGAAPPRSPSLDYPLPPVQTADGQVLGADGVAPESRLRASPRVGSGAVTPSEGPGAEQPSPANGPTPAGPPAVPRKPSPPPAPSTSASTSASPP